MITKNVKTRRDYLKQHSSAQGKWGSSKEVKDAWRLHLSQQTSVNSELKD